MEIGSKTYETPKMEVHQGLTAGAVAGGAIGTAKVLAPQLKDSFSKSISAQKDAIAKFKDSGKTVDEYIAHLAHRKHLLLLKISVFAWSSSFAASSTSFSSGSVSNLFKKSASN